MDVKIEANELTRKYKYVITFVLYFCYFVYAMNLCITGPSLLDLRKIYKTSFSDISNINTVRSFAYTFGSINGLAYQYMNRQLLFMFFLLIVSLTMLLTPLLPSINLLFLNFAINGFASGGIESSSDVWILEMWQQECGPFVQALHFFFALGLVMTPLVVEPFLSEKAPERQNQYLNDSATETIIIYNYSNTTETTVIPTQQLISNQTVLKEDVFVSRIYIPYTCGAVAIAFSAFIIGGLYWYKTYIPPPRLLMSSATSQTSDPKQDLKLFHRLNKIFITQLMPTKSILILIVLSGYLISIFLGLEWSQFNYFPSFAHFSRLKITEKRAAVIMTGLTLAFTIGRGIAIPLSRFIRPKFMIYGSLLLLSFANILFLLFANTSEGFLWFANVVYGLGLSPVYASIYAMVEEQTVVHNLIGSLFIFMSGLTCTIYPIILGFYIESKPLVLIYVNIFSIVISFLIMISIDVIQIYLY